MIMKNITIDLENLHDYAFVKERLFVRLWYKDTKFDENILQTPVLDMKMTYHILLDREDDRLSAVKLTRDFFASYNITLYQLYSDAIHSTQVLFPAVIKPLEEMVSASFELHSNLYYVSTVKGIIGSSTILYPDMPQKIYQTIGSDYYLIPSSTDEWLAIKKDQLMSPSALESIVHVVNSTFTDPSLLLSDHIYCYNSMTKKIQLA